MAQTTTSPYSKSVYGNKKEIASVNERTGGFSANLDICTITSGLQAPAVFELELTVGVNNKYSLGVYGQVNELYLFNVPSIFKYSLPEEFILYMDGTGHLLERITEAGKITKYRRKYIRLEDIEITIYRESDAPDALVVCSEVQYSNGARDLFNAYGELIERISPLGHKLIFTHSFFSGDTRTRLTKIEDEYGNDCIDIEYYDDLTIKIKKKMGTTKKLLTILTIEKKGSVATVKNIEKSDGIDTTNKFIISFTYFLDDTGRYYLQTVSDYTGKYYSAYYESVTINKILTLQRVRQLQISPINYNQGELITYWYGENNYTGISPESSEYYPLIDNAMERSDNFNYTLVIEYGFWGRDPNPVALQGRKETRTYNRFHQLIENKIEYNDDGTKYILKIYRYSIKAGNINSQDANFSLPISEVIEYHNTETEFMSVSRSFTYDSYGNLLMETDVAGKITEYTYLTPSDSRNIKNLIGTITTKIGTTEYNKMQYEYILVTGKGYTRPDSATQLEPSLALVLETKLYDDLSKEYISIETNEYSLPALSGRDWFLYGTLIKKVSNDIDPLKDFVTEVISDTYYQENNKYLIMKKSYKGKENTYNSSVKYSVFNVITQNVELEWEEKGLGDKQVKYSQYSYTYDIFNQLIEMITPEGTETYARKNYGRIEDYNYYSVTDIHGKTLIYYLNCNLDVAEIYLEKVDKTKVLIQKNNYAASTVLINSIYYDEDPYTLKLIERKTTFEYKNLVISKITYPDGKFIEYDEDKYLLQKTERISGGWTEIRDYDLFGNVKLKKVGNGYYGFKTMETYQYDECGNCIRSSEVQGTTLDYRYDKFNRMIERKKYKYGSHHNFKEEFSYPTGAINNQNIISIKSTDSDDKTYTYEKNYDVLGRVLAEDGNNYSYNDYTDNQLRLMSNSSGGLAYFHEEETDLLIGELKEHSIGNVTTLINYNTKRQVSDYIISNEINNVNEQAEVTYSYGTNGEKIGTKLGVATNKISDIVRTYSKDLSRVIKKEFKDINTEVLYTFLDEGDSPIKGEVPSVKYNLEGAQKNILVKAYLIKSGPAIGKVAAIIIESPVFFQGRIEFGFRYDSLGREQERLCYESVEGVEKNIVSQTTIYNANTMLLENTVVQDFNIDKTIKTIYSYDTSDTGSLTSTIIQTGQTGKPEPVIASTEFFSYKSNNRLETVNSTVVGVTTREDYSYDSYDIDMVDTYKKNMIPQNLYFNFSGSVYLDTDNNRISYNALNQIMRITNSGVDYDYKYYLTGELMCVSDSLSPSNRLYYIYDNDEHVGEKLYSGDVLVESTIYLDIMGIRIGRYRKCATGPDILELFFSDLAGSVKRVLSFKDDGNNSRTITSKEYDSFGKEIKIY